MSRTQRGARGAVYFTVLALAVGHHDFWLWDDRALVLGFLPAGLAYHVAFSVVVSLLWAIAVLVAWPHSLERFATADDDAAPATGERR